MAFTPVTLTGPVTDPDDNLANGFLTFVLTSEMRNSGNVVPVVEVTTQVVDGEFSQILLANDDSATSPNNQAYWVKEQFDRRRPGVPYPIIIPSDAPGGTIALGSITPASQAPPQFFVGITEEEIGRMTRPEQLAPAQGAMNWNGQELKNIGLGFEPSDAATLQNTLVGWVYLDDSWTFVDATHFTVPGASAQFAYVPGARLWWQEVANTMKYGTVLSASYNGGTGLTTVAMIPTTDFVMTANPIGLTNLVCYDGGTTFPNSFLWTPTLTGFSAAPTSPFCWFQVTDGIVTVSFSHFTAGTSNATTFTITNAPMPCSRTTTGAGSCTDGATKGLVAGLAIATTAPQTLTVTRADGTNFGTSGNKDAQFQFSYPHA